jgi:hypothetical protein
MSSADQNKIPSESTESAAQPLPKSFFWQIGVTLAIILVGAIVLFVYESYIGGMIALAGGAFAKATWAKPTKPSDKNTPS